MNNAVKAGEVFKLAELIPYQDGKIINMDFAHNEKMKVTSKNISPKAKKYGIIEPTNKVGDLDAVESICRR